MEATICNRLKLRRCMLYYYLHAIQIQFILYSSFITYALSLDIQTNNTSDSLIKLCSLSFGKNQKHFLDFDVDGVGDICLT